MKAHTLISALLALQPAAGFLFNQPLCQTQLATTKGKGNVKTSYTTKTIAVNVPVKTTIRQTVTTTPSKTLVFTSSRTVTVTSSQNTDTFTSTITQTSTNTVDITTTVSATTSFTTTATTTPTVTYSTNANFIPLASSAAYISAAAAPVRRYAPLAFTPNRPVVARGAPVCVIGANLKNAKKAPKLYPASVSCTVVKYTISYQKSTVTKTKTVAARTSTISRTTTLVSTQTVPMEKASTTLTQTVSTTADVTNTVSTTTTATETILTVVAAATPTTYFPMCESNNVVSLAGAKSFVTLFEYGRLMGVRATSETDCCQTCALNADCVSFAHVAGSQSCFLIIGGGSCSASPPPFVMSAEATDNSGRAAFVLGNGQCGQIRVVSV